MSITLFKATELASLENFIDPETGEIDTSGFDQAVTVLAEKQRAVVAYVKNQSAMLDMLKKAESELKAKRDSLQRRIDGLKEYLLLNMKASGTTEISAIDGTFSAKLYKDRDESVVIEDGTAFPYELCDEPRPPQPNKTKIKEAILRGEPVSGARIVRNDRLTIK